MELLKEVYGKLKNDKIKINWNKKPIKMDMFINFLTVPTVRSTDHLGCQNGWTKLENEEIKLYIGGGIVGGTEYLDSIRYGKNLQNPYNNFVNPFYLWEILTNEGIDFFKDYYNDEVLKLIDSISIDMEVKKSKLDELVNHYNKIKCLKK